MSSDETKETLKRRHVPGWIKWTCGVIIALLLIVAGAITAVVQVLKPEHLTALVEEYTPRFINGNLEASRIELTFWSTFPRLTLEADSLTLTSKAFDSLSPRMRSEMPQWADTLLTMTHFTGSVNLAKLAVGEIELYDVEMDQPAVNIAIAPDSTANFDIALPTAEEEPADTTMWLKSLTLEHFSITRSGPLRYLSMPDSVDATVKLNSIEIDGHQNPAYELTTQGNLQSPLLDRFNLHRLLFDFKGGATFDFNHGLTHARVDNLWLQADSIEATLSADATLGDTITLNALSLRMPRVELNHLLPLLGPDAHTDFKGLNTDLHAAIDLKLTTPYDVNLDQPAIPSVVADIDIPTCHVRWPRKNLNIDRFTLQLSADIDGRNLNASTLNLKHLLIDGYAIDLEANAAVSSPLANPRVTGEVKGRLITDRLPAILMNQLPAKIKGTIGLDTKFRLRQNQLNEQNFHKIFMRGVVSLREFDLFIAHTHENETEPDTLRLNTPLTIIRFDSAKAVETNGMKVDSLLSVTLNSDSLYYYGEGMDLQIKDLQAGLGTRNVAHSTDSTVINPFGGSVSIAKLKLRSDIDSIRLNLSKLQANALLTRFMGLERVPKLHLDAQAQRISGGTPTARITVRSPKFDFTANMNPRRHTARSRRHSADSTAVALGADTTQTRHRRHTAGSHHATTPQDSATAGLRNLLRRWDARGNLTAQRARLFTSAFPLRNTLRKIDLWFNTDTVQLRSLSMQAGASDFAINGTISGIKNSIGRRRNRQPLKVEFNVLSDTIDIDQLSRAVFAGAAAQPDTTLWTQSINEDSDVDDILNVDTTQTAAFIVPPGIDATLTLKAKNVIYTGMLLHNFSGELGMWDQAVHLHNLMASSAMGNIGVSALYNAPNDNDIEFGMGMQLVDFHIEKFLQVTPAIADLLPTIRDFSGVINADIAMTTDLTPQMDFVIPSMQADVKIDGDSLVLLDADTFKSLSKWLMFKNKKHNMIDHMSVELQVDSSQIILYPFIFNIDRYKLGVMGSNDLNLNMNYHVSVLKSPIPFKFGINITGNFDNMKIRLGGAKIKENTVVERMAISTDARINLINQIEGVFRRGANSSRDNSLHLQGNGNRARELRQDLTATADTLSTDQQQQLETQSAAPPQSAEDKL